MSHWADVEVELNDLDALAAALAELKLPPMRRRFAGQQPIQAQGYYGPVACDVAVALPHKYACERELALTRQPNGSYKVQADDMDRAAVNKVVQTYTLHRITMQQRRLGHSVTRQAGKNGTINLVITGASL